MTTNRPYRGAMPHEKAVSIIRQNAGTQFDPAVVEVFLRLVQSDPAILAFKAATPPAAEGEPSVASQLRALDASLEGRKERDGQTAARS